MELSERASQSPSERNLPFSFPPKLRLANIPTPLEYSHKLSTKIGKKIFIKRDDINGSVLCGNKIRKLEYILADAILSGAEAIMTCGATTSNHARTSAVAAKAVGLKSYLLLKRYNDKIKDTENANLYFMQLVGSEIRFCGEDEYNFRDDIMADWACRLNEKVYIVPEGGSTGVGILGYVEAYREIIEDCARLSIEPDGIIVAVGSGGTYAGLLIGSVLFKKKIPIYGYSVWRTKDYYVDEIKRIVGLFEDRFGVKICLAPDEIKIIDASFGYGYGETSPDEERYIKEFAEEYGIILDPVYTVRAINGFLNYMPDGEKFIFIHTGGVLGLLRGGHIGIGRKDDR